MITTGGRSPDPVTGDRTGGVPTPGGRRAGRHPRTRDTAPAFRARIVGAMTAMTSTSPQTPPAASLHTPVIGWFEQHARDLPWRRPEAGAWG
ncbi:hypothetical protein Smic_33890 [Streptomyces microflavus]|nr:hypothetical protein Smic_33890 [Streptomyces microflavus]